MTNQAAVWGVLKLSDEPLSVKDISEKTGLTYGQVRSALQGLKKKGHVRPENKIMPYSRWNDRPQRWLIKRGTNAKD